MLSLEILRNEKFRFGTGADLSSGIILHVFVVAFYHILRKNAARTHMNVCATVN